MEGHDLSRSSYEKEEVQPTSPDDDNGILCKVVEDPSEFTSIKEPRSLLLQHLGPNTELYVFMIPDQTIDPLSLVNSEVVVGGRKGQDLLVKNQPCKVVSYKSFSAADAPSLFLPDEMGELHQVNSQIKGHVIIKRQPIVLVNKSKIDIDALRSVQHKPPVDIKERNFLNNAGKIKNGESSPDKRPASEELDGTSPKILKKKKKKKRDTSLNNGNDKQAENEHAIDGDLFWDTSEAAKKKDKESKKVKNESMDISEEILHFYDDSVLGSPKEKKSKKKVKKESMDISEEILNFCDDSVLGSPKEKKSKKVKKESVDVSEETPRFCDDSVLGSPKKKKSKKVKKESIDVSEETPHRYDDSILGSSKKKKSKKLNITL